MDWVYLLLKIALIFLGIITVLIGKFLSVKFLMPVRTEHMVIDEKNFIKSNRMTLYCLGLYYIILGIMLFFIKEWPEFIIIFATVIPATIVVILSSNSRKYMK